MCPVGPYFATGGFNPVSLHADPSVVRAFEGGSGNYKMGANYGPTIYPHMMVWRLFIYFYQFYYYFLLISFSGYETRSSTDSLVVW